MLHRDRLTILTYHSLDTSGSVVSIDPRLFAQQMATLTETGTRGVSLSQAINARDDTGHWPQDSVVITFDDGFANLSQHALPVLVQHGFSATVFLVTDHIGGKNDWAPPPDGLGEQRILSWQQAKELCSAGLEMGAHTRTHPDLRKVPATQIESEIKGSRDDIEAKLNQKVATFAYPFGLVNEEATTIVNQTFRAACTTKLRRSGNELLALLPRVDVYYFKGIPNFKAMISGRKDGYLAIRRWGRAVRNTLLN